MDFFKIDQKIGTIGAGVADVKITTPEVTFGTSSEFNLAFFDAPSDGIKKEPEFDEPVFDSMAPDSIFSPSSEFSPFTSEESKLTSFSDSPSGFNSNDCSSSLSPISTPTISSPLPSPGIISNHLASAVIKTGNFTKYLSIKL